MPRKNKSKGKVEMAKEVPHVIFVRAEDREAMVNALRDALVGEQPIQGSVTHVGNLRNIMLMLQSAPKVPVNGKAEKPAEATA